MVGSETLRENTVPRMNIKTSYGSLTSILFVSIILLVYFLAIAYPLFWLVINSFKNTTEIYANSWSFPDKWLFSNYVNAWKEGISAYFLNSFIVTINTCILTLLISAFSAFALSRFQFYGKTVIFVLISSGLMFSPQVSLVPLYRLIQNLGIYDTYWSLILPYTAYRIPLTVLLIRTFFLSIPKDYEESASLDGCTSLGIFFKIFVPISKPILLTSAVLTAYFAWNEFMFANIFISSDAMKTVPAGLLVFKDALNTDWGVLLAGLTISALPLILLFIMIQKHFIRGLSEGGIKG